MSATRTVSVIIMGRVQGVSYRAWTQAEAGARGLSGFVRNQDDGSVEALFSGPAEVVDQMVALCRSGPPSARVSDISVREGGDPPDTSQFEVLRR